MQQMTAETMQNSFSRHNLFSQTNYDQQFIDKNYSRKSTNASASKSKADKSNISIDEVSSPVEFKVRKKLAASALANKLQARREAASFRISGDDARDNESMLSANSESIKSNDSDRLTVLKTAASYKKSSFATPKKKGASACLKGERVAGTDMSVTYDIDEEVSDFDENDDDNDDDSEVGFPQLTATGSTGFIGGTQRGKQKQQRDIIQDVFSNPVAPELHKNPSARKFKSPLDAHQSFMSASGEKDSSMITTYNNSASSKMSFRSPSSAQSMKLSRASLGHNEFEGDETGFGAGAGASYSGISAKNRKIAHSSNLSEYTLFPEHTPKQRPPDDLEGASIGSAVGSPPKGSSISVSSKNFLKGTTKTVDSSFWTTKSSIHQHPSGKTPQRNRVSSIPGENSGGFGGRGASSGRYLPHLSTEAVHGSVISQPSSPSFLFLSKIRKVPSLLSLKGAQVSPGSSPGKDDAPSSPDSILGALTKEMENGKSERDMQDAMMRRNGNNTVARKLEKQLSSFSFVSKLTMHTVGGDGAAESETGAWEADTGYYASPASASPSKKLKLTALNVMASISGDSGSGSNANTPAAARRAAAGASSSPSTLRNLEGSSSKMMRGIDQTFHRILYVPPSPRERPATPPDPQALRMKDVFGEDELLSHKINDEEKEFMDNEFKESVLSCKSGRRSAAAGATGEGKDGGESAEESVAKLHIRKKKEKFLESNTRMHHRHPFYERDVKAAGGFESIPDIVKQSPAAPVTEDASSAARGAGGAAGIGVESGDENAILANRFYLNALSPTAREYLTSLYVQDSDASKVSSRVVTLKKAESRRRHRDNGGGDSEAGGDGGGGGGGDDDEHGKRIDEKAGRGHNLEDGDDNDDLDEDEDEFRDLQPRKGVHGVGGAGRRWGGGGGSLLSERSGETPQQFAEEDYEFQHSTTSYVEKSQTNSYKFGPYRRSYNNLQDVYDYSKSTFAGTDKPYYSDRYVDSISAAEFGNTPPVIYIPNPYGSDGQLKHDSFTAPQKPNIPSQKTDLRGGNREVVDDSDDHQSVHSALTANTGYSHPLGYTPSYSPKDVRNQALSPKHFHHHRHFRVGGGDVIDPIQRGRDREEEGSGIGDGDGGGDFDGNDGEAAGMDRSRSRWEESDVISYGRDRRQEALIAQSAPALEAGTVLSNLTLSRSFRDATLIPYMYDVRKSERVHRTLSINAEERSVLLSDASISGSRQRLRSKSASFRQDERAEEANQPEPSHVDDTMSEFDRKMALLDEASIYSTASRQPGPQQRQQKHHEHEQEQYENGENDIAGRGEEEGRDHNGLAIATGKFSHNGSVLSAEVETGADAGAAQLREHGAQGSVGSSSRNSQQSREQNARHALWSRLHHRYATDPEGEFVMQEKVYDYMKEGRIKDRHIRAAYEQEIAGWVNSD